MLIAAGVIPGKIFILHKGYYEYSPYSRKDIPVHDGDIIEIIISSHRTLSPYELKYRVSL